MGKTLKPLVILFFSFFILSPWASFALGVKIGEPKVVEISSQLELRKDVLSFCIAEDGFVLLPNGLTKSLDVLEPTVVQGKQTLLPVGKIGHKGINRGNFLLPTFSFYSEKCAKFGVFDYDLNQIFIYDRLGKTDFRSSNVLVGFGAGKGYDAQFTENGSELIVAGYTLDESGFPYELYSINLSNVRKRRMLLSSHEKYNLKSHQDYVKQFSGLMTQPAIGVRSYVDIQDDWVYFVWEGLLRIIKLNLRTGEKITFGDQTTHYRSPFRIKDTLVRHFKNRNHDLLEEKRKNASYIRTIFANSTHVFLIYERGHGKFHRTRMQTYSTESGKLISDVAVRSLPGAIWWFSKEQSLLYSLGKIKRENVVVGHKMYVFEIK